MQTAPNMTPDYEVRLQLNPSMVLNSDHELNGTMISAFNMLQTPVNFKVQFLDTNLKDIYTAGWSARIRKTDNKNNFELTYKKRYTIASGDIDDTLTAANTDGFDAGAANYEAQVEWGYQTQILSITRKKNIASGNQGTDLPGINGSRNMLINEAPGKFDNWKGNNRWGTNALAKSRIFGPVLARRSIGVWNGLELYVEVWPILDASGTGIERFVEASFKTKSRSTASNEQSRLRDYLQCKGWLLPKDSLKTQLIMERY
jgi:hypothetical protein